MATVEDALKGDVKETLIDSIGLSAEDADVKKFIDTAHEKLLKHMERSESRSSGDRRYFRENKVFSIFIEKFGLTLREGAKIFSERYNTYVTEFDIGKVFDNYRIGDVDKRTTVFKWVEDSLDVFIKALKTKEKKYFDTYKNSLYSAGDTSRRLFCLALYTRYPELNIYDDIKIVENFGGTYARRFFDDITDILSKICVKQTVEKSESSRRTRNQKSTPQRLGIGDLRRNYKRNEMELRDLEKSFDDQLEDKYKETIMEFFSGLNSEKYGRILDTILETRRRVYELRKKNFELPVELGGLFILIDNIAKFVRENEINPIMKLGSVHDMKSSDIVDLGAEYDGTPYSSNADEIKSVEVVASGWYYKDEENRITRPKLKERI